MHGGCHILVASDIEFLAVNILQTRSTSKQGLTQRPWMSDQFLLIYDLYLKILIAWWVPHFGCFKSISCDQ